MASKHRGIVLVIASIALLAGCKSEGDDAGNNAGTGALGGIGGTGVAGSAGMSAGTGAAGTQAGSGGMTGGTGAAGSAGSAGTMAAGTGGTMAAGSGGMSGTGGTSGAGTGGSSGSGGSAGSGAGDFALTSEDVDDGAMLPMEHRCVAINGATGPSPQLSWTGAPAGTLSFAVTVTDKTYMDYAHWTLYDVPAAVTMLAQGVPAGAMPATPAGAKQAPNSPFLTGPGYFGPCGTSGTNTYEFTVHALDVAMLPDLTGTSTVAQVRAKIEEHEIGTATLSVMSSPP